MLATRDPSFKGAVAIGKEIAHYQNQKFHHNLKICKERVRANPIVIYTLKYSFLVDALNHKIDLFNSAGLITFWHSKFIDANLQKVNEDINHPRTLTLSQLMGSFQLLTFGFGVAFVVFFIEFVIGYKKLYR